MARLRQLNPGNYRSADRIGAEFENIVRYVNAAEIGDKTVGELLDQLFDSSGLWDGPVELRLDTVAGLQYRVGSYDSASDGWTTLASIDSIRGPSGEDVGTIGSPVISGRQDYTATDGQTVFSFALESANEGVIVFQNGLLLVEADYTVDAAADTVTLDTGATLADTITIYKVRTDTLSGYARTDHTSTAGQAVFVWVHDDDDKFLVYKNGILQREGGAYDYTASASQDTITFTSTCSNGDKITIIRTESLELLRVSGLMTEDKYTNGSGLIPYAKLLVADGDIAQAKVSGLTTLLANRGRMYVSATTPVSPAAGDHWLDTSSSPNSLKIYDGVAWLVITSDTDIPDYASVNANQFLRVNGTGTALTWDNVDLSTRVPLTYIGAANGVASLDSDGEVPLAQLPDIFSLGSIDTIVTGSVTDATYRMKRIFKEKIRIDGIVVKTSAGTCTVQIAVDGVGAGSTYAAGTTATQTTLGTTIEVDGTSTNKLIGFIVTSASTCSDLEVTLAIAGLTA